MSLESLHHTSQTPDNRKPLGFKQEGSPVTGESIRELGIQPILDSIEKSQENNYPILANKFAENNIQRENLELKRKTEADQMNTIRQQLGLPSLEDLTVAQKSINQEIENLNKEQNEILQNLGMDETEYRELVVQIEQRIKKERVQKIITFFQSLTAQEQTYVAYHGTLINGDPVQISGISFPSHESIKKIFVVFQEHHIEDMDLTKDITLEELPELPKDIEQVVNYGIEKSVNEQVRKELTVFAEKQQELAPHDASLENVSRTIPFQEVLPPHSSDKYANAETIPFEEVS